MTTEREGADDVEVALHSRGYLLLLLFAGVLGIPLSLIAFGFLAAIHELEHVVWHDVPEAMGHTEPPGWWAALVLLIASGLVVLTVSRLPGGGGHPPVDGLGGGSAPAPSALPGIVLAATASLVGGAVVGPEAPLLAIGGGLAVMAVRRTRAGEDARATTIIGAAGSAAAISAIFGNPLIAAVMLLEVLGLGRRQMVLVVLPCLLSSGVGALLFTGLGEWTGLEIGALTIPDLQPERLSPSDIAWAFPLAAAVAVGTWLIHLVGERGAALARTHLAATTIGAGLVTGACAWTYAALTGHSPEQVALSGQATLAELTQEGAWTTGALAALLVLKAVAYAVCLGTFRGGPLFPAIFVGAAAGVLVSGLVPGLTLLSALAIGAAAGMAMTGLPVSSVVLIVLLLGESAASQMPVIILAVVTAMVVRELLDTSRDTGLLRRVLHRSRA